MANKKISELPLSGPVQPTDNFVLARGGKNYKVTAEEIGAVGGGGVIVPSQGSTQVTRRFQVYFGDMAFYVRDVTARVLLLNLPPLAKVIGVTMQNTTSWSGTGMGSLLCSIGSVENGWFVDDFYASGFQLISLPDPKNFSDSTQYQSPTMDGHGVTAVFNADSIFGDGRGSFLKQGSVIIWVTYLVLP